MWDVGYEISNLEFGIADWRQAKPEKLVKLAKLAQPAKPAKQANRLNCRLDFG